MATWQSSDTSVATVVADSQDSNKATITFLAAGSVTISATINGITGTHDFTVASGA